MLSETIPVCSAAGLSVTMLIDSKVKGFIHRNAEAGIGIEGLMGNKEVNIRPVKGTSPVIQNGDLLAAQKLTSMDQMLQTHSTTNKNVAIISEALKTTVLGLDTSAIFNVLNDKNIGISLRSSLKNINYASSNASDMTRRLDEIVLQVRQFKGSAGVLLTDTAFAGSLRGAVFKLRSASENANKMTVQLNNMAGNINDELAHGKGPGKEKSRQFA